MLNIFKSPPKPQSASETIVSFSTSTVEENLLVKQFNGLNIAVYGTYEEPLFKASDIGDLLEIKKINDN